MRSDVNVSPTAAPAPPPLLVRAPEAAHLCGVSEASWHRLRAAGRTPAPLRLGGSVVWRMEELREWCEAGCPARREWETRRAAQDNGRSR